MVVVSVCCQSTNHVLKRRSVTVSQSRPAYCLTSLTSDNLQPIREDHRIRYGLRTRRGQVSRFISVDGILSIILNRLRYQRTNKTIEWANRLENYYSGITTKGVK